MTRNISLSICGDVERPARLAPEELRSLMDAELVADFTAAKAGAGSASAGAECGSGPCSRSLALPTRPAMSQSLAASTPPCLPAKRPRMSGCSLRWGTKEPRAPACRLPAAGRALRLGLLSECQVG